MASASALVPGRPQPQFIAGRYEVRALLGQGGMGAVYRVFDSATGRELALKRLNAGSRPNTLALFEREYRTLAGLRHPNIVEVYDYSVDDDGAFYTMELIEGSDLSKQAPMPWRTACRVLRDAASILGLLHARALIHRDLSPRNLLRSANGRVKLIDFGALAKFGPSSELVGTPPFVPPEALRSVPLDQRADLFSLGALAYWLVTGVHAFPARALGELPALWENELVPPSRIVATSARDEPLPEALDALIASLLRIDPHERLASTSELIDQLNAIASLEGEQLDATVQGYLESKAFVGRERERERAQALITDVQNGTPKALLIEGAPGVGRSRYLQELAVTARLMGATPLFADAQHGTRPYGGAEHLLLSLLRTLPTETRMLVAPHQGVLGLLSRELRTILSTSPHPSIAQSSAEQRVRTLNALRDVFLGISRERFIAVLIDDLHDLDEESQALLAALSHAERGHRLLIAATYSRELKRDASPAALNLRERATRFLLLPLTVAETHELLKSVFGDPPYLSRLSERLHRLSGGNAAYCLELAHHLVASFAARYADGAWTLPTDLPDDMPPSRHAARIARLDRLSEDARVFSRRLSVPHDAALTIDECFALSDLPPHRVHELLDELVLHDVLHANEDGYRFVHAELRGALWAELDAEARALAHRRLAEEITAESRGGAIDGLRAALHSFHAGDTAHAYDRLQSAYRYFSAGDVSALPQAAPLLEQIHALQKERGEDQYGMCGVVGLLAVSSYFVDQKYRERYGDLAISMLQNVLRFDLIPRFSRYLGGKLALMLALFVAGIGIYRRRDRTTNLKQTLRMLMSAASALCGTCAVCIDPDGVLHFSEALRPFAVFGRDHAAGVTFEFSRLLLPHLRDQPGESDRVVKSFLARLESPKPIRDLPEGVKANYVAGAIFTLGVGKSWHDGPECLQLADKLETFGPLYAMSADYLRASYYAGQGDLKRANAFRERMDMHAVQLGSAWQVENWAPADAVKLALRTHDASALKRATQELARLAAEIPSIAVAEAQARGAYLTMRRRYVEAIAVLETDVASRRVSGYMRARGVLARAYNGLGQHEKAKQVCLEALQGASEEDLSYVASNLHPQVELALAESGLGHAAEAVRILERLIEDNRANDSAVTLGALHHARARVALAQRDFRSAHRHLDEMQKQYGRTDAAALFALVAGFKRELTRTETPEVVGLDSGGLLDRVPPAMLRVQLLLSGHGDANVGVRARTGLQVALELSGADEGFVVLADHQGEPAAHLGSGAPSHELVQWAERNMLDADADLQTVMTAEVHSEVDSNYKVVDSMRYCVVPLWGRVDAEDHVVAALVLGFDDRVPRMPDPSVMRAIAEHVMGSAHAA